MRTSILPFFDRPQLQLLIKYRKINSYGKRTIHFKSNLLFYRIQKSARCAVRLRRNDFGFFSNRRTCFCDADTHSYWSVPGLPQTQ